jgi:hypothetical protein
MPWFKIDDGFHGHPKVVELDLPAVGLWTLAGSWCSKYLTDGAISLKNVRRLGGDAVLGGELVAAGLWLETSEGYQFKDWEDYQPLKEVVEAERQAAQERMRAVRAKKKGVRPNTERTSDERSSEPSENFGDSSEEVRVTPSHPSPTHPIPSTSNEVERTARKRASRLDPKWMPSNESVEKAREDAPDVDHHKEHSVFVDYWIAQPGQKGVKTDWDSTWRNWMRRAQKDLKQRGGKQTPTDRARQTASLGRPPLATELIGLEQ